MPVSADQLNKITQNADDLSSRIEAARSAVGDLSKAIEALQDDLVIVDDKTRVIRSITPGQAIVSDYENQLDTAKARVETALAALKALRNQVSDVLRTHDAHDHALETAKTAAIDLKKAGIANADKAKGGTLTQELAALEGAIATFKVNAEVDLKQEIIGGSGALKALVAGLSNQPAVAADAAVESELRSLVGTLLGTTPKISKLRSDDDLEDYAKAAEELTKGIKAKLQVGGALHNAMIARPDLALVKLRELRSALETIKVEKVQLVVKIIEAKFGDTHSPQFRDCSKLPSEAIAACGRRNARQMRKHYIASRWCDATASMSKLCNGEPHCSMEASFATSLCGYNPAPTAPMRNRGVFVSYVCVPNVDASFVSGSNHGAMADDGSKVAMVSATAPQSMRGASDPLPQFSENRYVVLRSDQQQILCSRSD